MGEPVHRAALDFWCLLKWSRDPHGSLFPDGNSYACQSGRLRLQCRPTCSVAWLGHGPAVSAICSQ